MKRIISLILCLCFLGSAIVFAAPEALTIHGISMNMAEGYPVTSRKISDRCMLFLTDNVDLTALPLEYDLSHPEASLEVKGPAASLPVKSGDAIDLTALCGEDGPWLFDVCATLDGQTATLPVTIKILDGLGSMYLRSDDPVNQGRPWVEASPTKDNAAKGNMLLLNDKGETVYNGKLTQIKGRGNSTWLAEKKPYQIKLDKKTDLLETGDKANANKTWVLLTNHTDPTLMRSQLVYDLSVALSMEPAIQCKSVNLYYDGEYRGVYLLCEKVEIQKGRVDVPNLEDAFELANPGLDFDSLSTAQGKTLNGASYIYCPDLKTPESFTGGYLLEIDTAVRATAEKCYFITKRGTHVVVKNPEYCSQQAMDYIATLYQDFELTLFNGGVHPQKATKIDSYIDMKSLAQCYIINELSKNPDSYRTSAYFFKDLGGLFNGGPVWDYDLSFGIGWGEYIEDCANPEGLFALQTAYAGAMYEIPAFREVVRKLYDEQVYPLIKLELLPSLRTRMKTIASSAEANNLVWNRDPRAWAQECETLKNYITVRYEWLYQEFMKWNSDNYTPLDSYKDVDLRAWYHSEVMKATRYGLMSGMGHRTFAPEGISTRAQAAKVLYSISKEISPEYQPVFSDVPGNRWYTPAIMWAYGRGVVMGYKDGTFGPDNSISRQDLVVLLYRYLGEPEADRSRLDSFADAKAVKGYAKNAMSWAIANGIVMGYQDNTLRPEKTITRAEMAALMVRYYEGYILNS